MTSRFDLSQAQPLVLLFEFQVGEVYFDLHNDFALSTVENNNSELRFIFNKYDDLTSSIQLRFFQVYSSFQLDWEIEKGHHITLFSRCYDPTSQELKYSIGFEVLDDFFIYCKGGEILFISDKIRGDEEVKVL